ncbi:uncharacterized protein A4U43_C04F25610 [Asparagus officinalis]|uniref:Uncharacterized protein n=1 Tax=Asparagus officinalis TaxID=4686 RepID=A0A5P1F4C5_ASPOF|nr:uncharacterized protein A4U43_C04F25610 [Asparagus officinalis]
MDFKAKSVSLTSVDFRVGSCHALAAIFARKTGPTCSNTEHDSDCCRSMDRKSLQYSGLLYLPYGTLVAPPRADDHHSFAEHSGLGTGGGHAECDETSTPQRPREHWLRTRGHCVLLAGTMEGSRCPELHQPSMPNGKEGRRALSWRRLWLRAESGRDPRAASCGSERKALVNRRTEAGWCE